MSGISIQLPPPAINLDDLLSKALSDSVACLFSPSVPIPFANVQVESVSQELQPVPFKWQTDVAIDDQAVFDPPVISGQPPLASSPVSSAGWTGSPFFDGAVKRLGLTVPSLGKLIESEDAIAKRFGHSVSELTKMKKIIKNELKDYDNLFKQETGRDPSRADKEPMRMLYSLYRKLRDMIVKLESNSPHAAVDPQRNALEDRLDALYEEKQNVRAVLQEYQSRFLQEQGRRIKYHRDIVAVDREYRQYKQLKEEIAKLETQLGRSTKPSNSGNDFFP